ncbi:MAG: hypothetical protein ACYCYE_10175 [Clostridia bacterium]
MNTKGKSILIVEDDNKIRNLIKIYLEKQDMILSRQGVGKKPWKPLENMIRVLSYWT